MRDVFIIGSKGIPASYGGFETFVDNLISHQNDTDIRYHVACMQGGYKKECEDIEKVSGGEFYYKSAHCFTVKVPSIGPAKAVYYDLAAFSYCIHYIKKHACNNPIVYILACRIGPFVAYYKNKLERLGGTLLVNPDGHEWMRDKWNMLIKKYWKYSEKLMVKHADLLVCDSVTIENYIRSEYAKFSPNTTYIAYGTDADDEIVANTYRLPQDVSMMKGNDLWERTLEWYQKFDIEPMHYYLIVGRFVPENNYEFIIRDFMRSKTNYKLVIISNVEKNKFYDQLLERTDFEKDDRIIFAGTVYDTQLLKVIRYNATAYLHGHEVGGTNPSLLEALACTQVNMLLEVGFNKEVARQSAVYFKKEENSLVTLMSEVEAYTNSQRQSMEQTAKQQVRERFSHEKIVAAYEELFKK